MEFVVGRDPLLNLLQHHLGDDVHSNNAADTSPARIYLRERNAMAGTAVDVKEYPTSYVFIADMPGLKSSDIKKNSDRLLVPLLDQQSPQAPIAPSQVTVESGNVLVVSGERRKEEEPADVKVKYLAMERRGFKFMRKFTLPSDADVENISAACQDGVLTVTVPKIPPPAPKVISVNVN